MGTRRKLFTAFLAVCFMFILQPETVHAEGEYIKVNGTDILTQPQGEITCGEGKA